jgi:hypothetical protein
VLVVGPLVAVLVWWLLLLAVGLDHVPAGFMVVLAIPPISSFFDLNLVLGTFRGLGGGAIALLFGLIALRAIIWAAVIGSIVEVFDRGRASSVGLAWAVRALPATLAYLVANVAAILVAQVLASALGSLGSLIFMLAFVGALYFLVFTPVAAIRSPVPFREALRRSVAVARFPGSRHVGLVFLYFFISFFPLLYALQAPGPFAANPTISQWAIFLGLTLVHVVFIASFAYRYIAVEDEIPEPAPRPARGAPASRRRR